MKQENAGWLFEQVGPMGGASGNAYANTLQGAGRTPEEELAREAIQNSCDAFRVDGKLVRVGFKMVSLRGKSKHEFLEHLGLQKAVGPRLKHLKLPANNCLADAKRPLDLLYVEDFGTTGLSGDPHSKQSSFYKLLLSLGESGKTYSTGTGGSYGYGKAALSMNSRVRTIVAYTRFASEGDRPVEQTRLMGCSYFDSFEHGGKEWTGRAWLGIGRKVSGQQIVSPVEGDAAQPLAESLGFVPRAPGELGTSILVVDCAIDCRKLVRGIEDCWWPRIVDQELEVVVNSGAQDFFPQPKRRPDLLPLIECYQVAIGRSQALGAHQKTDKLNRLEGTDLGAYAFCLLNEKEVAAFDEEKVGRVAAIRSPKMVVEYVRVGRPAPPAVGVFVADTGIDDILKLSEPPAHDRWDPESIRLQNSEIGEEKARAIVRAVSDRLRVSIRKFQLSATPPKPVEERRLRLLERELGALFHPEGRARPEINGVVAPVELVFTKKPAAVPLGAGQLRLEATAKIRLKSDAEEETLDAILRVRVPVLEDEDAGGGDLLPLVLKAKGFKSPKSQVEPELEVTLSKKQWIAVAVQSAPYDGSWSTRVDVQVVPAGAE